MTNALDKVREAALELPETEEKLSHGQPTFFVAGKQFAQFRDNHHGDGKTVVCVKTSGLDEQAMLLEADPDTYSKPPYLWPSGWVSINLRPTKWIGTMLATASPPAGSLRPRVGCWKQVDDEQIRQSNPPPLDQPWRNHRPRRAGDFGDRCVDCLEK